MISVDNLVEGMLRREGGYVNNPNDHGGPTKYGVTQATLSRHLGREATIDDVKDLTKDMAKDILLTDYLYTPRIHTLPEVLQPQLFDCSVNSGPKQAITMLQTVLNMAGYECSIDGVVGPTTRSCCLAALSQLGNYLVNAVEEYREYFYQQLVANDPTQQVFLAGWIRRAQEFRQEIV